MKKFILLVIINFFLLYPTWALQVAITVDDVPANGELPQQTKRVEAANKMLAVFAKHHIKNVYAFLNGGKIDETIGGNKIISLWIAAEQLLGNHTYNHTDLAKHTSNDYIGNIKKMNLFLAN